MKVGSANTALSSTAAVESWIGWVKQSTFVRDVAGTFGTRIVLIIVGVLSSVLTTRLLGPAGRGTFAVATAVSALCIQFGNMGLHASNTYVVVRRSESLPMLMANSLAVSLVLGVIIGAILSALMMLWPTLIGLESNMLTLVLLSVPLGIAYLLLQNLLIGIGRIQQYNWIEVGMRVGVVALLGGLIVLRWITPWSVFCVTVVASAIGCIVVVLVMPRFPRHLFRLSITELGRSFGFGIKAYTSALFAYMTLRFDLLMVQHYQGNVQTGYYSIAATYGDLVYLLPIVVGTLLFPRLVALPTDADRRRLAWRAIRILGPLMVGVVVIAGLVSPIMVRLLYGARFMPASPAIVWLMPGLACLSINTLLMNYFASLGMPPITVIAPGLAAVLNVALNTVLIPSHGIVGASMASSVAYAAMLVSSVLYIALTRGKK